MSVLTAALAVPRLEAGDPTAGVQDLLLARVERVAVRADLDVDLTAGLGAAGGERVATTAVGPRWSRKQGECQSSSCVPLSGRAFRTGRRVARVDARGREPEPGSTDQLPDRPVDMPNAGWPRIYSWALLRRPIPGPYSGAGRSGTGTGASRMPERARPGRSPSAGATWTTGLASRTCGSGRAAPFGTAADSGSTRPTAGTARPSGTPHREGSKAPPWTRPRPGPAA